LRTRSAPTLREIEEARSRIAGVAHVTPVQYSETFSRLAGRKVLLKAENLQRTGSFKARGAVNRISTLSEPQRAAGVVAASAGNHGQAVAWAAREVGVRATVFMPQDAPMAKIEATRNYGAEVELAGESFDDAMANAQQHVDSTGATFVPPFEDELVIAGQGTIGLELAEQVEEIETVVVPVGGGGLASGIALALHGTRPEVKVVGVQAEACAPFAGSTEHGFTIADGIAVKQPGELTSAILDDHVEAIATASEDEISRAILLLLERVKFVVEGAGAVGLAAVLAGRVEGSGPVVIVLSGGNIDPSLLIAVMRHGMTLAGRYLVVRTRIPDRPGELVKLLGLVAAERVNVVAVEHHREGTYAIGETEVELTLGTRDEEHREAVLDGMRRWGYPVARLR
jgi:threonine dehydratase